MQISNTPDFHNSIVQAYQPAIAWDLCKGITDCQEGERTIYVRFLTKYNVVSDIITTTVTYTSSSGQVQGQPTPDEDLLEQLKKQIRELQLQVIALAEELIGLLTLRLQTI
ncbi:hypothetical protein IID24_04365 [Patescibacteria group bacterium]|nr:hypothetical protein [Patescibacteria group bacterium]